MFHAKESNPHFLLVIKLGNIPFLFTEFSVRLVLTAVFGIFQTVLVNDLSSVKKKDIKNVGKYIIVIRQNLFTCVYIHFSSFRRRRHLSCLFNIDL